MTQIPKHETKHSMTVQHLSNVIDQGRQVFIQRPAYCSICLKLSVKWKRRSIGMWTCFREDCLQKWASSNSATSNDVIELTPIAGQLGTFCRNTAMSPNFATERKIQKMYEFYISDKTKILPIGAKNKDDEKSNRKRIKNQKRTERHRSDLEIARNISK